MTLMDQLQADLKTALRAREEPRLTTIRSLLAAVKNEAVTQRGAAVERIAKERGIKLEDLADADLPPAAQLSDADIHQVINREVKKRQDAIETYRKANRAEAAAAEEAEAEILRQYLPKQLSADELRPLVQQTIAEVGAISKADMKKVMPVVMSRYRDRADGRTLNQLVQELLP
jgi:uncharacterized protein YqeY